MTNSNKPKTNYDDEIDIINEVHELEPSECFILSDSDGSNNYLKTVAVLNTYYLMTILKSGKTIPHLICLQILSMKKTL